MTYKYFTYSRLTLRILYHYYPRNPYYGISMNKRLDITDQMRPHLFRAGGEGLDLSSIAVFEALAINNRPLPRKNGTLFEGAVFDDGLLQAMAGHLNRTQGVPLHLMHNANYELPVGKVFYGDVRLGADGRQNLHVLFYLPLSEAADLINKIETSTIDEVSVGVLAEHIYCSECGFDYLGADATLEHLWTRTCANGHTIGENGTHARLVGLDEFFELSLVGTGGADNAKIVSRGRAKLAPETAQRLAANGLAPEIIMLSATANKESKSMTTNAVTAETLLAQVTDLTGKLTLANAQIAELEKVKASVTELTGKLTEADKKVAEFDKVKASVDAAKAALSGVAKKVLIALGNDKPEVEDKSIEDLTKIIDEGSAKLAAAIPAGGVTQTGKQLAAEATANYSAFTLNK